MATIPSTQLAKLLANKPRYSPATLTGSVSIPTEILEGDVVDVYDRTATGGYPIPVATPSVGANLYKNGTIQSTPYTTIVGDAGTSFIAKKSIVNELGAVEIDSPTITVGTVPTFRSMGFLGGNVNSGHATGTNHFYLNAGVEGRGFGAPGSFAGPGAGSGAISFSNSAANATAVLTGAAGLAGNSFDNGRIITVDGGKKVTITSFISTSSCNVQIGPIALSSSGPFPTWYIGIPTDSNGWPAVASELIITGASDVGGSFTGYISGTTLTVTALAQYTAIQIGKLLTGAVTTGTTIISQLTGSPQFGVGTYQVSASQTAGSSGSPITIGIAPSDGQLPAGAYKCTVDWTSTVGTVSLGGSSNLSAITGISTSGQITNFTLTLSPGGATTVLQFSQPINFLDVPRDGSTTTVGKPDFDPVTLAYYSQFSTLRFLDFMAINGDTQVNWADRPNPNNLPTHAQPYCWEQMIAFCNAVKAYPGSVFIKPWICLPGNANTDYCTNLATLINNTMDPALTEFVEYGNEPWNPGFILGGGWIKNAALDAHALINYGITGPTYNSGMALSSVTSNGATPSVITVTTKSALSSYVDTTGTPFISDGIQVLVIDQTNSLWSSPGASSFATVPITVTGANTFTYTASGNVPIATTWTVSTNFSNGNQWAAFFNLNHLFTLDYTGTGQANSNLSAYNLGIKWGVRGTYQCANAWHAIRPNAKFLLNQQPGVPSYTVQGNNNSQALHYQFGHWMSTTYYGTGPISGWLYGGSQGSYMAATANRTTAAQVYSDFAASILLIGERARALVFATKQYGLHTTSYESGPDQTLSASCMVEAQTGTGTGAVGDLTTQLLDTWFLNGGEEINHFYISPLPLINGAQGNNAAQFSNWGLCQSFSDMSPKRTAFLGYSRPKNYVNEYGSPGDLTIPYYQRAIPFGTFTVVSATQMIYWSSNTIARNVGFTAVIPRGRNYSLILWGSDSIGTTTMASIWVDGVQVGTQQFAANGPGANTGTIPLASPSPPIYVNLTSGGHAVEVRIAANTGTQPGVFKVALVRA